MKVEIKLSAVEDVKKFVKLNTEREFDCDVVSKYDNRHCVDGRSLLGLFSLNLSDTIIVTLVNGDEQKEKEFEAVMRQFQ